MTGLSEAIAVGRIEVGENFSETIGFIAELDEDRRQETTCVLLGFIPKIKIEVSEGC